MRWWGWGDRRDKDSLSADARAMLRDELGDTDPRPAVSLDDVSLPKRRKLPRSVVDAAGEQNVFTSAEARILHAVGKGYPDLVRLRSGKLKDAPDAVITPVHAGHVQAVLDACARERVGVIPFGGGTSVVGGVNAVRGELERIVSLDLSRLRDVEVDMRSLSAQLGPGLLGPEAERRLGASGVTLGHFPQSFEYATIGGFAATRSAGQASTGYGRFDALVNAITLRSPSGELALSRTPHSAAGPTLRELVIGSEGAFGVITEVGVRVRPAPAARRYEGWMVADFAHGIEIARGLAQDAGLPDVFRLSDREETRISMALSGTGGMTRRLLGLYLSARRRSGGCIVICGWEGDRETVARRRSLSERVLRRGGAVGLGKRPGRAWARGRYEGPYLRDELLDRGVMVETLETAHSWSGIEGLYEAVTDAITGALKKQGTPGIVMCHVSHLYADGASLYFTFIARQRRGDEIKQWRAVKKAASKAIVRVGGTITHHHAVGCDHIAYMEDEVGELGVDILRSVKDRFDPTGIMNPGKLVG